MYHKQLVRRLAKLEMSAGEDGICVACIKARTCQRPDWQDTRRCGLTHPNLPDMLHVCHEDQIAEYLAVDDSTVVNKMTADWMDQVKIAARQAGLGAAVMEFLEVNLPMPERILEVADV
jgi:hypothetical protein